MGCNEDVKIAGVLHDTVEDTDTTIEDIKSGFGGNKLSNIFSLYDDYKVLGDKDYDRFNANKDMQAWYYGELLKIFTEYKEVLSTLLVTEYETIYKKLFVEQ